jgi:ankyrin repeat protein
MRGHIYRFKKLQQSCDDLLVVTFRPSVNQTLNDPFPDTGRTCLHWAASCGHVDVVRFLCTHSHETLFVNTCDALKSSASHLTARYGHTKVIQCLLQYARINAIDLRDKYDCTPFWYAAAKGHLEAVRVLERHANVDSNEKRGYTPLAVTTLEGRVEVVRFLLSFNSYSENIIQADPSVIEANEHTPLNNVVYESYLECIELLREHGGVKGKHIPLDSSSSDIEDEDLSSDEEALA